MKALHGTHASARGSFNNIAMNGQEVFKFAVRAVPAVRNCLLYTITSVGEMQMSCVRYMCKQMCLQVMHCEN